MAMRDHKLRSLFNRIALLSVPVPLTMLACGGSTGGSDDQTGSGGSGGTQVTGSGGSTATGGSSATGGSAATGGSSAGGTTATGGSGTGGSGGIIGEDCLGPARTCAEHTFVDVPLSCLEADDSVSSENCSKICSDVIGFCTVDSIGADHATVVCEISCAVGRRPYGFDIGCEHDGFQHDGCQHDLHQLAEHFARSAQLEAASVFAFRDLRSQLSRLGAPKRQRRALSRAARDEQRHTRAMTSLARRFGAKPTTPQIDAAPERSVEQLAIENAIEGCVRETYGALSATWTAQTARDPGIRATFRRIAHEETRHAALSWEIHRWLQEKLDQSARARVQAAMLEAQQELGHETAGKPPEALTANHAVPPRDAAQSLFASLQRELWAKA
jgi:rubrerythrin